jgi:hypothetical protein
MSDPAASSQMSPPAGSEDGLMLSLAALLTPLFAAGARDVALAHRTAVSAIEAYNPQSRADLVNIARTIAFSMTALALLGATASQDMTLAEQMRAFGRANALNRSADQSERTMMRRRRESGPQAELAQSVQPPAPDTPVDDAEICAEIVKIVQQYAATQPHIPEVPPPEPSRDPIGTPLALADAASATAIYPRTPRSSSGEPQAATYRASLLRHAAMPPMATPRANPMAQGGA